MAARRRLLMQKNGIGYEANVAWARGSSPPTEEYNSDFFITGFIPYAPENQGSGSLTCRYSNGFSDSYRHYAVFYGADKQPLRSTAYYDMTVSSGVRTITFTASWLVNGTKYIRFCGRLLDIDDCYVYDNNANIYLWKKGM